MLWNDIVIIEYARTRSGLPSAPLDVEYDNSSKYVVISIALNIQHNP